MTDVTVRVLATATVVGAAACAVGFALGWPVGVFAVATGIGAAGSVVGLRAWQHRQLATALLRGSRPGRAAGVALRWRGFAAGAAVAGLVRPQVFCDPRLTGELSPAELHAVVWHERHHVLRRDPLRLVALAAVRPLALAVPGGRAWLARRHAALEIAADGFALRHGATRPALAGALVKLQPADQSPLLPAFGSVEELRLRALVEGVSPGRAGWWWRAGVAITSVGATGLLCMAGWWQYAAAVGTGPGCVWPGC